ncbi:MAG TPA: hypothetical protein VG269_06845 [Tepidisphaeraceae bacterium]|jgi:hypothetical protein|nr:hypothetical protein [Tepidisphaeraceae bacterium]
MQPTTIEELAWLHDAILFDVVYDFSGDIGRSIKLSLRCHADSGYAPWNGRNLVVVAVNVAVTKSFIWGWVIGPETLDAIRPGVSGALRETTAEARRTGARLPSLEFTISFHSGSEIEVICESLQLDVGPIA